MVRFGLVGDIVQRACQNDERLARVSDHSINPSTDGIASSSVDNRSSAACQSWRARRCLPWTVIRCPWER